MKKKLAYDFQTAREKIMEHCSQLGTEEISLDKAAGRVLAEDVQAQYHVPLFDKSPLDGYAFLADNTRGAGREHPVCLNVVEEIAAGAHSDRAVQPMEAVKILTGAPIPAGATAVAKYEETEETEKTVTLFREYKNQENIIKMGEDILQGEIIAGKGTFIDAAVHASLASQGISSLSVYKEPMIGIISQGNELISPGEELYPGKIYNTNRYMLSTTLKTEHISSIYLGKVNDDQDEIARILEEASCVYDAVIMTGGVSVGTYDYTERAMEQAGAEILVDRVKMKPGSSCCISILNGVPVFGLSGNPSAAMTTFHLVALPAIRWMAGRTDYLPEKIAVTLGSDYPKKSPNTRILKGHLCLQDGTAVFSLNVKQGNGMVSAMRNAEVFAVVPAGSGALEKGCRLEAYLL